MERLRADVEHLAGLTRDSAGPGERASAEWIAGRLREIGCEDARVEPYRGRTTYAWAWFTYLAFGLFGPRRLAPLLALAALELDGSGRRPLLRWPSGQGANVVAGKRGQSPFSTVVLVAHHDAAKTGLMWHPALVRFRRGRNRRIDPYGLPLAAALVLRLLGAKRLAGALGALNLALLADVARGSTVPGANDNATGVAAVLALAADPPPGVDVRIAITGCEESGMDGMRAYLEAHPPPPGALVISLDTLGCGTPIVLSGEGVLLTHRYPDLVGDVERWRIGGWTDPVLAAFAGHRAISLLSMGPEGTFTHYHHPSDVPEHVDFDCVERCIAIARRAMTA